MRYFSVCSGIEAATVGWHRMGWEPVAFSEIEPFPAAVLKHHYPNVPNLGDMTKIDGREYRGLVDVLVGGTPCQAFSVAGLRRGLIDPRGNLTLIFAKLADDMDVPFVLWENVPGVLSSKDNAFGCFLGLLAGEADALVAPGGKWTDAGFVLGPQRAVAWRVLDAQYFGLAQRRRRVFVVACPRNGADPREILFEREGVRRDTPPSREAGQGFAHDVAPCIGASGRGFEHGGDTRGQDPVVGVFQQSSMKGKGTIGWEESGAAKPVKTQMDGQMVCITGPVTHALKAEGFDGSEDGTGRGQPIVCQEVADTITNCFHKHHGASGGKDCLPRNHVACFGGNNTSGPIDVATARNASGTASGRLDFETETFAVVGLRVHGEHSTAMTGNGDAKVADFVDCTRALDTNGGYATNQGGNLAVMTLAIRGRGDESNLEIREDGTANALFTPNGGRGGIGVGAVFYGSGVETTGHQGDKVYGDGDCGPCLASQGGNNGGGAGFILHTQMQVRRLTPRECERLQGFPDDYTQIPWKNKPAEVCPDGPRYKALGNSMAVPCMRFIGRRIELYGKSWQPKHN